MVVLERGAVSSERGTPVYGGRKAEVELTGRANARPVHLIITMIKWIRTSRLSIKNSLYGGRKAEVELTGRANATAS